MTDPNIIRAWKDPEYRASLSDAEREALPEHPAGLLPLSDEDLEQVGGGFIWWIPVTAGVISLVL